MEAVTARDFLRGWFWGMIAVATVASIGVRLSWARFLQIPGAEAAGDFMMFAVILGSISLRTASVELSVGRRTAGIVLASAVATGVMAFLRTALL